MRAYLTTVSICAAVAAIGFALPKATPAPVKPKPVVAPTPPPAPVVRPVVPLVPNVPVHTSPRFINGYEHVTEWLAPGVSRLSEDGANGTHIDFSSDPSGKSLKHGDAIDNLFAARGVVFRSARTESPVAIDSYVVSSKSRGLSAATKSPRWTGDVFMRFIDKARHQSFNGNRVAQASFRCDGNRVTCDLTGPNGKPVHRVGLWIAHVVPMGSGLAAYDVDGNELGRIVTKTNGSDYLGLSSKTPIGSVRVFAVDRLDSNFTIDDLYFE